MSGSRNQVSRILALARAGEVVWWRRDGFTEEPFREVEPKWHVLTGRLTHLNTPEMDPGDKTVYTALCGHKKSFDERIRMDFPNMRKLAPKKDTRCRRCVKNLPEFRALQAERIREQPDAPAADTEN